MDLENAGICVGCLSSDRRLQKLAGDSAVYYHSLLANQLQWQPSKANVTLCWECGAEVRRAVRLRQRVQQAASILLSHMKNQALPLQSLSSLSSQIQTNILLSKHKDEGESETAEGVSKTDAEYSTMDSVFVKIEGENSSQDYLDENYQDNDLQVKTGSREEFVSSDDEPLTLAKKKKDKHIKRSKKKKDGREKRSERTEPSGVVHSARANATLAALGVPPGKVQMVLLTWEEVEWERQRALTSERYTRHSLHCERCALGFNHSEKLRRHMDKHVAGDSMDGDACVCSACGVRCGSARALAAHRRRHRLRWRCAECGALWSRAAVAADHAARAHGAPAPAHPCSLCPHTASSLGKLRAHLRCHSRGGAGGTGGVSCDLCGKTLRDRASLRTHLFIHRGEKEHECPHCGKRFLFKRALQLHQDTHTRPAPLYCHQCDVAFKNRMSYYQHMRYNLKHIHPDRLKHECTDCGKRFARGARLAEHTAARHTGLTPVRCAQPSCSFACASRGVLRAHVSRVHRGRATRRTHVCHACGNTYTTKKSLDSHEATHSKPTAQPLVK